MKKNKIKNGITIAILFLFFFLPIFGKVANAQDNHTGIIWVRPNRADAFPVNGNRTGNTGLNLAFEDYHVIEYFFLDSLYIDYYLDKIPIYQIRIQEEFAHLETNLINLLHDCYPGFFSGFHYPYNHTYSIGGETISTDNGFISLEFVGSNFDQSLVPRTNIRSYNKKMDLILRKYDIKSYTYDPYVSHISGDTIDRTIEILCHYQDLLPLYNDLLTISYLYDYIFIHGFFTFFDSDNPCGSYSGISDEREQPVFVFPNPTQEEIFISGVVPESVIVYDVMGKMVVSEFDAKTNKINIKNLPKGMYILKIISIDGKIYTDKIIKE